MILELIGFMVLLVVGLYVLAGTIIATWMQGAFGEMHRRNYVFTISGLILGLSVLWLAFHLAPFSISIKGD